MCFYTIWLITKFLYIDECKERKIKEPEFIEMSEAFRVNINRPSYKDGPQNEPQNEPQNINEIVSKLLEKNNRITKGQICEITASL